MGSEGIQGLYIETHNWGKAVAFWKALGYELEFETDHHSGQLRHPSAPLWLFIAERPEKQELTLYPIVIAADAASFEAPSAGRVERPFTAQHWDVMEELLRDPDGRAVSVQAPLPKPEA